MYRYEEAWEPWCNAWRGFEFPWVSWCAFIAYLKVQRDYNPQQYFPRLSLLCTNRAICLLRIKTHLGAIHPQTLSCSSHPSIPQYKCISRFMYISFPYRLFSPHDICLPQHSFLLSIFNKIERTDHAPLVQHILNKLTPHYHLLWTHTPCLPTHVEGFVCLCGLPHLLYYQSIYPATILQKQ